MAKDDKARSKIALGDERRLTAGYAHHGAPAWSRDGRTLLIAVGDPRDASWVLVDRRGRVARTLEGPAIGRASFAPDGSIAFTRRFGQTSEIWLTPGGDAPPVRLLGGDGRQYRDPAFSPDGATLACAVTEGAEGRPQLLLLRIADGHRVLLTDPASSDGRADTHPDFVPHSDELVFEGSIRDDRGIYVLSLRTQEVARLTPVGERACRPTVVDAARLCYERRPKDGDQGPATLVLLDRERAKAQILVEDGASRCQPACWTSAQGKLKLAYAAQAAPSKNGGLRKGEPPRFDIFVAKLRGLARVEAAATTPTPIPTEGPRE